MISNVYKIKLLNSATNIKKFFVTQFYDNKSLQEKFKFKTIIL